MKKILFILAFGFALATNAQKIQEADFVGNVRAFTPDSTITQLDKNNVQIKAKATGSKIWWGIGSTKQFIEVPGKSAKAKIAAGSGVQFFVRGQNNSLDPSSVVMVFKMEVKGSNRRGQMGKVNNFVGNSQSGFKQIDFEGKKFGTSSYIIDPGNLDAGEYGIVVLNPDKPNDTNLIVYSFSIQ